MTVIVTLADDVKAGEPASVATTVKVKDESVSRFIVLFTETTPVPDVTYEQREHTCIPELLSTGTVDTGTLE